jgi:hypothetical protein
LIINNVFIGKRSMTLAFTLRDPLLTFARGFLNFMMAIVAIGGFMAIVATILSVPAAIIMPDGLVAELAKKWPGVDPRPYMWAIAFVLLCSSALLVILWHVFRFTKRIVDTVAEGDPFVPENALRLTRMAWLMFAVQVITIPVEALASWLAKDAGEVDHSLNLSGNGLLLVLMLFILARVFHHGTQMRAELEGTV